MDAEEAGDIGCRSTGGKHGDDLGLLLRGELGLTAATASLGTRRAQLYPAAKFPPITIAIGRATTAGTANAKGLYIGLEALRSEEHTSELQSLMRNSYAVFCLKNKTTTRQIDT